MYCLGVRYQRAELYVRSSASAVGDTGVARDLRYHFPQLLPQGAVGVLRLHRFDAGGLTQDPKEPSASRSQKAGG